MIARGRFPLLLSLLLIVVSTAAALLGGFAADAGAASGSRLWARIVDDVVTAQGDHVIALERGADSSVYACGVYDFPLASGYLWAARYSSTGNQLWLEKYGESLGIDANANAMTVDRHGSLIVAGRAQVAGNGNALVVKYSRDGALRWARQYDGVAGGEDFATDVVVDGAGGVYLAAASTGPGPGLDYLVVKYSAAGVYQWECRYERPGTDDIPAAIAIDGDRNTYVTGASPNAGGDGDCVTIKVGAGGARRWAKRWAGPGASEDEGRDIAVAAGAIYVEGSTVGVASGDNVLLVKYATAGARRWVRTWDGPAHRNDNALGFAVDRYGNAWTAGSTLNAGLHGKAVLIKWDTRGRRLWVKRDRRGGILDSRYHDLAIDGHGTAWCAGDQLPTLGPGDVLVAKYSTVGRRLWSRTWDGTAHGYDAAHAVCLSGTTSLYVGGWTFVPGTATDPALLKYRR